MFLAFSLAFFIYDCGETAEDTQMLLKLIQIDIVGKTISVFKGDTCFSLAYLITFTISPSCLDSQGSEETGCELLTCLSEIMTFTAFQQVILFSLNLGMLLIWGSVLLRGLSQKGFCSVSLLSLSSREEAERALPWLVPWYHSSKLLTPQTTIGCTKEKMRVAVFPRCIQETRNMPGNVTSRQLQFLVSLLRWTYARVGLDLLLLGL